VREKVSNRRLADRSERARSALAALSDYMRSKGINKAQTARALGVPERTLGDWYLEGKRSLPSPGNVLRIEELLAREEQLLAPRIAKEPPRPLPGKSLDEQAACAHAEHITMLLLLLHDELAWFKDADETARATFRTNVDPYDAGYVSSLLTMLSEEGAFQRWRLLTTYRFRRFRGKRR